MSLVASDLTPGDFVDAVGIDDVPVLPFRVRADGLEDGTDVLAPPCFGVLAVAGVALGGLLE